MELNQIESIDNFDIKSMTTFKIGGIVKRIYFPKSQEELIFLLKTINDPCILGGCSNVLFSSDYYDGEIISTSKLCNISIKGTQLVAECGAKGPKVSQMAYESSLSGFEFMIGFPGSIGGNVYMNAGAHGQNIAETFVKAFVFDKKSKEILELTKEQMNFGYRTSILQNNEYVLLEAEFQLKRTDKNIIKEFMDRNIEFRKNIQPSLANPNAGSIFKNPENDSAGRLLDKAGVKNLHVDNVEIWQKHANFIINAGNAKSEDVLELIYKMYTLVKETYTIELEPEVKFIGKMSKREEEICKQIYKKTQK